MVPFDFADRLGADALFAALLYISGYKIDT
jgi:hypothetical protein